MKECMQKIYEQDGIQTPYARIGTGSKNLVVLPGVSVRAVSGSAEAVGKQYQKFLDSGYTIWLLDRRETVPEKYTFEEMAADTSKVLTGLGLKQANVFGASQGGVLGLCLAEYSPELVKKLAVASCGGVSEQVKRRLKAWEDMIREGNSREIEESFLDWMFGRETLAKYRKFLLAQQKPFSQEEIRRFGKLLFAFRGYDIWKDLGKVSCPVCVFGCRGDQMFGPEAAVELQRKLNASGYIYGPEYGHAFYDEAPDFPGRLLDFFNNNGNEEQYGTV